MDSSIMNIWVYGFIDREHMDVGEFLDESSSQVIVDDDIGERSISIEFI